MYEKAIKYAEKVFCRVSLNTVILIVVGILSGKASVFYGFSPFGTACLAAYFAQNFSVWTSIFPIIGYIISGKGLNSIQYITSCLIITVMSLKIDFFEKYKIWNLSCCCSLLLMGIIKCFITGFYVYDLIIVVLECIMSYFLYDFYDTFISYFSTAKLRHTATRKELCAVIIIMFTVLSALSDIVLPLNMSFTGIISLFIIMCFCMEFDAGICGSAGTILGILASLTNSQLVFTVGSYSVSAIFGCLAKRYGKIALVLTMIISNALMTYYVNGSTEVLINIYEVFVAGAFFLAIPVSQIHRVKENIMLLVASGEKKELKRMEYMKQFTYKQLIKLSGAFSGLSTSLNKSLKKVSPDIGKDMDTLIKSVAERTCKNCRNFKYCWQENYDETSALSATLINIVKKRGWAENYDLPSGFKKMCYNPSGFILDINKIYELYRVNLVWENKITESRQLIASQMEGMSQIVTDFAENLKKNYDFETDTEKEIIELLDMVGVCVTDVTVVREINNRMSIKITVRDQDKKRASNELITAAADKITGKRMKISNRYEYEQKCYLDLKEDENFIAETAVSRVRPNGEQKWGDSYAVITPDNGKIIVALSDGMGTGNQAADKSNETVGLLDKLLVAGIDKVTAIKLINSVLILKSYDESFATLDMMIFDLYTGDGEFIKTGGVSSYIKRGNQVIEISSGSLPTGIVGAVEPSNYKINLRNNDVVIIASDGVTEVQHDDKWLKEILKSSELKDARVISDLIMNTACGIQKTITDDMTVMVTVISQK